MINSIEKPLVSILVHNFNYGQYLEECLASVIAQTYENIEIVFSDNASTDNSWEIAETFAKKYEGKVTVIRNRYNVGPDDNLRNCYMVMRGRYCITLCSDDVLLPNYVEKCLGVFNRNPHLGFVMVHYTEIDGAGKKRVIPPFYNQSCVIDGEEQAAVYMMAAVNPSISQVMYDWAKFKTVSEQTGALASRWYRARIQDFNMCLKYPVAYINEPLLLYRLHGENDSLAAGESLLEIVGPYILLQQFKEKAGVEYANKVSDRYSQAIDKLAFLALRYSVRYLQKKNVEVAKQYFHLSAALSPKIEEEQVFESLSQYWVAPDEKKEQVLVSLGSTINLVERQQSYEPPPLSKNVDVS